ncbi:MAG: alpha/beta hydrolase [Parachlamydiales bacterium]|nr:alpha/beta hydrolase [Parachlamydiales bacterium]
MKNYFYDAGQVRYHLYQSNGGHAINWLFFPGGPGADSSYLTSLVDCLDLPGNVWLIDLPGNGDHVVDVDFDSWMEIFPKVIQKFQNPVLVGHSFGGMLPLLYPEMEEFLKGFVILNSAPSLWLEAAFHYSRQFELPDLTKEMQEFTANPSQETFDAALAACMPYYFPKETLEKGRAMLLQVPFQYPPAVWWQRKVIELNFTAKWVPQTVPTMIVGAKYDCIVPFSLFEKDQRFHRDNIQLLFLKDAGHCGWIENPKAMNEAFAQFAKTVAK